MEGKDIAKISLKGLKIFFKTYQAKSPEIQELKEDLGTIITAIQHGDSNSLVECNNYIVRKYSIPPSMALKYNLTYTTEKELILSGLVYQAMALHQIGHLLEDALKKETIITKISTALKETCKEVVTYCIANSMEKQ